MSLRDVVRERACPCAWCLRPTWNLNAVCNRRECRQLEDRYRLRRANQSASGSLRGDNATHLASVPGPAPSHLKSEVRGAASSGEGVVGVRAPVGRASSLSDLLSGALEGGSRG